MSRKEPKTLRVACFEDGRRKIITFKRGAYWWSPSEGAYPRPLDAEYGALQPLQEGLAPEDPR
ncbi:hypothetical protein KBY26_12065 [Ruegeria pomeroyi]|nr:hypothetical protein [Ruegeria pomeroyi]